MTEKDRRNQTRTNAAMSTLKDVSIIVKWNGKEFPILDLSDQETVAVLKHEIAKLTNVRPERQKLLNLKHKGLCRQLIHKTAFCPPWFLLRKDTNH